MLPASLNYQRPPTLETIFTMQTTKERQYCISAARTGATLVSHTRTTQKPQYRMNLQRREPMVGWLPARSVCCKAFLVLDFTMSLHFPGGAFKSSDRGVRSTALVAWGH